MPCAKPCFTCDFYELLEKHRKVLHSLPEPERQPYMISIFMALVNELSTMTGESSTVIKASNIDRNKLHYESEGTLQ